MGLKLSLGLLDLDLGFSFTMNHYYVGCWTVDNESL